MHNIDLQIIVFFRTQIEMFQHHTSRLKSIRVSNINLIDCL